VIPMMRARILVQELIPQMSPHDQSHESQFISNCVTLAQKKKRFSKPPQVLSSTWEGPGESLKGL